MADYDLAGSLALVMVFPRWFVLALRREGDPGSTGVYSYGDRLVDLHRADHLRIVSAPSHQLLVLLRDSLCAFGV